MSLTSSKFSCKFLILNTKQFLYSSESSVKEVFPTVTPGDIAVVQEVCNAVSNRAAKLAAAGKSSFLFVCSSLHLPLDF